MSLDPDDGSIAEMDDDPWLGSLFDFPHILHARASFEYEINTDSLQKAIVAALCEMTGTITPIQLSLSDHKGYLDGNVRFRVGIGNADAFDLLDHREQRRLLRRIEEKGVFTSLDFAVHASYRTKDGRRHMIREDRFLSRLIFQAGLLEVYVHHLRGMRRVHPEELIRLIMEQINNQLESARYPRLVRASPDRSLSRVVKAVLNRK